MNEPLPVLEAESLTRRYGERLGCRDVSLKLWPGEVLGIVGESGSGKSTLLNMLSGRMEPSEGRVIYRNACGTELDLHALSEGERRRLLRTELGYVHQNPRDGLRMQVSAGANIGERLMAAGGRNYGKLRASAGIQHTDYMPTYGMWLPTWDVTHGYVIIGSNYGSTWGASLGSFPTIDFAQETATSFNLGTDLRLANALDISVDAFYQLRSHIMLSASNENSSVVGIQSAYNDVGEVKSYGFEAGAKYVKEIVPDLHLNLGANLSWARNEVTQYIGTPTYPLSDPVGHRVNEAWGLKSDGFFKDQADIDGSYRQEYSNVSPGDIKYKDLNGDQVINQFDVTSLDGGTGIPELNYAFNIGLEYKGFGLNAWFQGTGNYMKYLPTAIWGGMADNGNLSVDYYNNCWDVAGDKALFPRLTTQTSKNNSQASDVWYKPVHFLKMRNIELYYNVPETVLAKLSLTAAKVFVQGENLLSFDNVDAMDAEVLSTAYPLFKGVNIGVSLTF